MKETAAAERAWEERAAETEEMAVLNKVGSEGLKPSRFNWERSSDIIQSEKEHASSEAWDTPSSLCISAKVTEPQRLFDTALLPISERSRDSAAEPWKNAEHQPQHTCGPS